MVLEKNLLNLNEKALKNAEIWAKKKHVKILKVYPIKDKIIGEFIDEEGLLYVCFF